ncbi:MAG: transcription termination/antitermination protein NusA [Ruminococcaceae bacterium]|nr:transcription termination/antitermination protein NusA [Oscillospiraceae bacterium]
MNAEFMRALNDIAEQKGIDKEIVLEALEAGMVSAYKKNYNTASENFKVDLNKKTGEIKVYIQKEVLASDDDIEDDMIQISLEEAKKYDASIEAGDILNIEDTPKEFGRIAAQAAKQMVVQKVREAERQIMLSEFAALENGMITGIIQRSKGNDIYVDIGIGLGKQVGELEAILPANEQSPADRYYFHQQLKLYVANVKTEKVRFNEPAIMVSRTRVGLVENLLKLEVPEIADGTVEIKAISRVAGSRTKVAVVSHDSNVEPIGACVGKNGMRIQKVMDELNGEKIDIVLYYDDPVKMIRSAFSPVDITDIKINPVDHAAMVFVDQNALSLAIGKNGQNARLAVKLCGFKIDIKPDTEIDNYSDWGTTTNTIGDIFTGDLGSFGSDGDDEE